MAPTMPVSVRLAGGFKERYRSMRGYKVPENAVRVSRFLAWCGNFLNTEDGAILAGLLQ
jgi:hypothetical protein